MEREDLLKILHGDIYHISQVNETDVALYEMEVTIAPKDVKTMMLSYLAGNITADDLTNWAGFLCIRAEYTAPESVDEDYYEGMWDVIQCLSTPEIDGEVNEERVRQYLSELDKYPPDSA